MAKTDFEFKNNKIAIFITNHKYRYIRHALLLIWLFLNFFSGDYYAGYSEDKKLYIIVASYMAFVFMIYINMYILIPEFLFKNKYFLYVLSLILLVTITLFVILSFGLSYFEVLKDVDSSTFSIWNYYSISMSSIMLLLLATTMKLFQRWIIDNDRFTEIQTITHELELNELRKQVSPHFLFNMLNNIKSLVRTNPKKASEAIIKLSSLLRYQLYESTNKLVTLHSEIEFIKNFMDLEKIRRDNFTYSFNISAEEESLQKTKIPSNLFMPFVENAIKHSNGIGVVDSTIKIRFLVNKNELYFSCMNSIPANKVKSDRSSSGLGLLNIRRRLELLYREDSYSLDINNSQNYYNVILKIFL